MSKKEKKEITKEMREEIDKIKLDINKECFLKVFNVIKENEEDVKKVPASEMLSGLGISLIVNLIQNFLAEKATDEEKHKAASVFLSAIGANAQKAFDEAYKKEEVKEEVA
jgi:hypothetical protein